jgi:hypothetical protein
MYELFTTDKVAYEARIHYLKISMAIMTLRKAKRPNKVCSPQTKYDFFFHIEY